MISIRDYMQLLNKGLLEKFPDEQFLVEELSGVIQAIINSVRWSALRLAERQLSEGNSFNVEFLETSDHFCWEYMEREEIINRIENTSGLPYEISAYALKYIEFLIDHNILSRQDTEIENLGLIQGIENGGYYIYLAKELKVSPGEEHGQVQVLYA